MVGSHQAGHFSQVRVTDSKEDLEDWEEENKENIRRLIELLRMIQAFFKESTTRKVSIWWRKNTEELVFYDIEGSIVDVGLPEDMKALWQ